jgi:hypothetical protein
LNNNRNARQTRAIARRSWASSVIWAVVAAGLMLTFAVIVNSFIPNRAIHWDWVALMMVFGSAACAWARRRGVI